MTLNTEQQVKEINTRTRAKHQVDMEKYKKDKVGNKPILRTVCQLIGCYCFSLHCQFLENGGVCSICQQETSFQDLDAAGLPFYTCLVCKCTC